MFAGGAVAMSGVTPSADALFDGVPLEQPPSNRQGFGRLQLSNSLPLAGATRRLQAGADSGFAEFSVRPRSML